jgi:hypothetical protein
MTEHVVQFNGEFLMKTLVATDQLVTETETREKATLLEPKNGTERPGEEDTFYTSKGEEAFREGSRFVKPLHSP